MPDQEPNTRDFLVDVLMKMEERFNAKLDRGFEQARIKANARFTELETRFDENLEKVETKLLRAFYDWARPMEMRVRKYMNHVIGVDERLVLLEERISRLEMQKG